MARQVRVEVVMDDASYVAGGSSVVSTNTKIQASNDSLAVNSKKVADAQVAAILKVREASKLRIASFSQTIAAGAGAAPGSREAEAASAATVALQREQGKLARSYGQTTIATRGFSTATKEGEKELSRVSRGALAGSGVMTRFGRSLAFASNAFLGVAIGASVIAKSITSAEDLAKAQDSLAVAIEHTGGNLKELEPRYTALAKGAAEFGQSQLDATTGLARATVLTGDAAKAQRAYQEALVISKATGKDFNAVLTATAKGQEGVVTSLRRYGILVKTGESGTAQLTQVMQRFGGQAAANTSASDKLRASFANAEAVIGTALLPTFNRLATSLGNWLQKMNQTGQLQKDVNRIMRDAGAVFHVVEGAVKAVDKVTGSFVNTLKVLAAFKFASLVLGWVGSLDGLIAKWGGVTLAADAALAAEERALAGGGGGGSGGGGGPTVLPFNVPKSPSVVDRVGKFTAPAEGAGAAALGRTGFAARTGAARFLAPEALFTLGDQGEVGTATTKVMNGWQFVSFDRGKHWIREWYVGFAGVITPQVQNFVRTGRSIVPQPFQVPGFGGQVVTGKASLTNQGPFGSAQPIQIWKNFQLRISDQIAQAQASLTKGTQDDVAVAKTVVAHIKQTIAKGHLQGAALIQALGQEASALSTIWSSEQAAAQARAARAQAQQQRIQAMLQNLIDPLNLEVQLSREQAQGTSTVATLRALRASARKALASGKLSLDLQKQAWDQITSLNQQIAQAIQTGMKSFTEPMKLQLALAREQAFGQDTTKTLLKMKAAALKAIRSGNYTGQALIDLYNQVTSLNQQLGASANSALSGFKQASTKALTAGLPSLSAADRKALRARLSQLGPGGTVPGPGVGAYGYAINPQTDRPIILHHETKLGDKVIERSTTRLQQKHRRRNPGQRRGPNAGLAGA